MRIGMLLPSGTALHDPGDGRVIQAKYQADALEQLGHEVIRMKPWDPLPREYFDVLHIFEGGFGNYVAAAGRPHGFRTIAVAPFIDSNMAYWLYRLVARAHLGSRLVSPQYVLRQQSLNSDVVIVRSEHERERFLKSYGIPESKISIVLNGVDPPLEADPERVRSRLGLPEKFVLHVGKYTDARKNALRLAEAVVSLKYPLIIAGGAVPGQTLDRLRAMAGHGVRLLDFVDRQTLRDLYAACHVFALPSIHEGTGLVALEAASYGANIVITKNGGPRDYFGKHAIYVDPANVSDITDAIRRAWDAPKSNVARDHVINNLSWRQSAEQLISAYRRAGAGDNQK